MIIGEPKTISPAFNNLYIYATSSNINEPSYKYKVLVATSDSSQNNINLLASQVIRPRYGDDFLEYNANKIVQSQLGDLTDDINFNGSGQSVFMNSEKSGINLIIGVSDLYQYSWDFTGVTASFLGNITLEGGVDPLYQTGDVINITGLATYFAYNSITSGPGNRAKFNLAQPHNLVAGDFVLIQQNSPFTYPIYNGYYEIIVATNPLELVIDLQYQGGSVLPQTGQLVYNDNLDGPAIVTISGGSFPNYTVEINKSATTSIFGTTVSISPTQSGTTRFIDSRLSEFPNSVMKVKTIFNGGMDRKDWLDYQSADFSTINQTGNFRFLSYLPNNWTAKLDNDFYLNFWNNGLDYDYLNLVLTTKDCNGAVINEFTIPYDGPATASVVQTINVGPSYINAICPTVDAIKNGEFDSEDFWTILNFLGGTASIAGGVLNYLDADVGDGTSLVIQENTLIPGTEYVVTINVNNNNFVLIRVGDENDTYSILDNQNGTFTLTFTATGTDFYIEINSNGGVTQGVDINYITVVGDVCDIFDCDVCSYDIRLDSKAQVPHPQIYPLEVDQAWQIFNFNNGFSFIDNGILQYTDLVEFGGIGASIIAQECVYTPGQNYTITINITNNENVLVQAGQTGTLFPFGTTGSTGTFTQTFTASNSNFVMVLSGVEPFFTNGATIDNVQVTLNGSFTASSETYNFEIDCECEGRYTNYPIIFKDRLGSFITFNFDLNNRQKIFKTTENYNKFVGDYSSRNVTTCGKGGYRYSLNEAGTQVFSTLLEEEWELNADAMTEEESVFFEQLVTSPRAAIKIDGNYYAIYIKDNQYERVRKNNEKMIYHKLFIRFANNNPISSL